MKKLTSMLAGILALLVIIAGIFPAFASAATTGTTLNVNIMGSDNVTFVKSTETNRYSTGICIKGAVIFGL